MKKNIKLKHKPTARSIFNKRKSEMRKNNKYISLRGASNEINEKISLYNDRLSFIKNDSKRIKQKPPSHPEELVNDLSLRTLSDISGEPNRLMFKDIIKLWNYEREREMLNEASLSLESQNKIIKIEMLEMKIKAILNEE